MSAFFVVRNTDDDMDAGITDTGMTGDGVPYCPRKAHSTDMRHFRILVVLDRYSPINK